MQNFLMRSAENFDKRGSINFIGEEGVQVLQFQCNNCIQYIESAWFVLL